MDEYTKLSIHNHFNNRSADLTIDRPIGSEAKFDLQTGYDQIREAKAADYQLLAQTNSNNLDVAAYLLMRKMAALHNIELLPGVEINLLNWTDESKVLHVVVVLDPDSQLLSFSKNLNSNFIFNGRYALTINQLCELLCDRRAVICVHGLKQDDRGLAGNPPMAQELLSMNKYFPVAIEDNRSFHKLSLEQHIKDFLTEEQVNWFEAAADISSVDRSAFDGLISPTYMWAGASFDDLFYSVLMGDCRMVRKEDIVNRVSYVSRIIIEDGMGLKHSEISCSQGLNCVIGPSGSGKTLLLDILSAKLRNAHLSEQISSVADYDNIYESYQVHLYGPSGEEIDASDGFEVVEGENLYNKVIKAYSSEKSELINDMGLGINSHDFTKLVTKFTAGMNSYLADLASADKARADAGDALAQAKSAARFLAANEVTSADTISYNLNPSDAAAISELDIKIKNCSNGIKTATENFNKLITIASENDLSHGLQTQLIQLRNSFLLELDTKANNLKSMHLAKTLDKRKRELIYEAVQTYNGKVSGQFQQVNQKKQVLIDKLSELASNLLEAKKTELCLLVPVIDKEAATRSISLVSENDIARLKIEDVRLSINDESRMKEVFPSHVRTRATNGKARVGEFSYPLDLTSQASNKSMLELFYKAGIKNGLVMNLPLEDVIEYAIELRDMNSCYRSIEEYSAGMLSKIYVSYFLDRTIQKEGSNTIVLYDQPESNMEKEFLLRTLGDKLKELRKTHQIFVATHEPLLVVNADANEIILANNDKRIDATNCISYENRSFVGAHGKRELVESVASLIDGGTDAVKRRSTIYEGMVHR